MLLEEVAVGGGQRGKEKEGGGGEEEKEGARGAAKQTGVMKACREHPREGTGSLRELPKEKEGDKEAGKVAVMMNGEGAQRKFWENREKNHRGKGRAVT